MKLEQLKFRVRITLSSQPRFQQMPYRMHLDTGNWKKGSHPITNGL